MAPPASITPMTNSPRVFLWIALALLLWLNYETWMRDYGPQGTVTAQKQLERVNEQAAAENLGAVVPEASTAAQSPSPSGEASAPAISAPAGQSATTAGVVRVRTDVLDLEISLQGGTIQRADLLQYPQRKGGDEPVRLLNHDNPLTLFLLQSGLTGPAASGSHPTHLVAFSSPQEEYELGDADELRVPLTWTDGRGITVTKTFILRRGQYRIDLEQFVKNDSASPYEAAAYAQILRNDPEREYSMFNVESYAFRGPAVYDGSGYRKLDIEDADDRRMSIEVANGWIAALQHHFVTAVVPPEDVSYRLTLNAEGRRYLLSAAGPLRTIAPGESATFHQKLFVGPKLQAQLEETGPRLDLVADYGRLTILANPLFWLLERVHSLVGNWGWAIVIVTFLLKLLFYPLSEASGRSMAKMRTLAPRIKNLQETYKDDREKLGRAMMELYQREKINPVAGCLPILVQIPVFLAFYWVLVESVEMRQAPFMGWIDDLSSRDPYFVLPAIMAVAMFVQYKLNPTPPDPVQAKVFMIMPILMSVMFAFFPAGLVLYWVTNTILSIIQQWNINRRIEAAAAAARKN